ncbi:putative nicastrin [Monocercomonoides exilis]|uniref:putative nicastrin n=1 Tax=Monocercomonoides exilis TaxID=2049356 RepID=UPI00355A3159|nr:putative nicastrin [Monocercomonoides exilis]|eukprot:MONOS_7834.1-p1 / transcript=MONOS_7834.1 / gene=MONOS_7834 / organism=Monocercomonoides_exilis_PA203 / gene_product=unspecified product / transcript_product=unspecified product / location=Mono_scaffold00278:45282-55532(+) / protein_length=2886 / sequence_SO=supercontig / SO=protein_coding / is_pseudo=false
MYWLFGIFLIKSFALKPIDVKKSTSTPIDAYPLIRYLNTTSFRGSQSNVTVKPGILYEVQTQNELNEALETKLQEINKKLHFSLLLNGTLLSRINLEKISNHPQVASVVVADDLSYYLTDQNLPPAYTPDCKGLLPGDSHFAEGHDWNANGDCLFSVSFPMPVLYVMKGVNEPLFRAAKHNKAMKYSKNKPLFQLQSNFLMEAEGNSIQCLNEGKCTPLTGRALWGNIGHVNSTQEYVLLTSPFDTLSEFYSSARGASSEVSSVATLMGAVRAITDWIRHNSSGSHGADDEAVITPPFDKTVLIGLFPGTNWGNFGAKRFACNIKREHENTATSSISANSNSHRILSSFASVSLVQVNQTALVQKRSQKLLLRFRNKLASFFNIPPISTAPSKRDSQLPQTILAEKSDKKAARYHKAAGSFANITFSKIKAMISIGDISTPASASPVKLVIHKEHNIDAHRQLQQRMVSAGQKAKAEGAVSIDTETGPAAGETPGIPPSPAAAFWEYDNNIPTVHICTHGSTYNNPVRHSRLDTVYNATAICEAATVTAKTVLSLVGVADGDTEGGKVKANCSEIEEVMDCLINNAACPLVTERLQISGNIVNSFYSHETTVTPNIFSSSFVPIQSALVGRMLQNMTGRVDNQCSSANDCKTGYSCEKGTCIYTPLTFFSSYSPYLWYNADNGWYTTNHCKTDNAPVNKDDPIWTESNWKGMSFKLSLTSPIYLDVAFLEGTNVIGRKFAYISSTSSTRKSFIKHYIKCFSTLQNHVLSSYDIYQLTTLLCEDFPEEDIYFYVEQCCTPYHLSKINESDSLPDHVVFCETYLRVLPFLFENAQWIRSIFDYLLKQTTLSDVADTDGYVYPASSFPFETYHSAIHSISLLSGITFPQFCKNLHSILDDEQRRENEQERSLATEMFGSDEVYSQILPIANETTALEQLEVEHEISQRLEKDNQMLKEEVRSLRGKLFEASSALAGKMNEVSDFKNKDEQATLHIKQLTQQLSEVNEKLFQQNSRADALNNENVRLSQRIINLELLIQNQYKEKEELLSQMAQRMINSEGTYLKADQQIKQLTNTIETKDQEAAILRNEIKRLNERIATQEKERLNNCFPLKERTSNELISDNSSDLFSSASLTQTVKTLKENIEVIDEAMKEVHKIILDLNSNDYNSMITSHELEVQKEGDGENRDENVVNRCLYYTTNIEQIVESTKKRLAEMKSVSEENSEIKLNFEKLKQKNSEYASKEQQFIDELNLTAQKNTIYEKELKEKERLCAQLILNNEELEAKLNEQKFTESVKEDEKIPEKFLNEQNVDVDFERVDVQMQTESTAELPYDDIKMRNEDLMKNEDLSSQVMNLTLELTSVRELAEMCTSALVEAEATVTEVTEAREKLLSENSVLERKLERMEKEMLGQSKRKASKDDDSSTEILQKNLEMNERQLQEWKDEALEMRETVISKEKERRKMEEELIATSTSLQETQKVVSGLKERIFISEEASEQLFNILSHSIEHFLSFGEENDLNWTDSLKEIKELYFGSRSLLRKTKTVEKQNEFEEVSDQLHRLSEFEKQSTIFPETSGIAISSEQLKDNYLSNVARLISNLLPKIESTISQILQSHQQEREKWNSDIEEINAKNRANNEKNAEIIENEKRMLIARLKELEEVSAQIHRQNKELEEELEKSKTQQDKALAELHMIQMKEAQLNKQLSQRTTECNELRELSLRTEQELKQKDSSLEVMKTMNESLQKERDRIVEERKIEKENNKKSNEEKRRISEITEQVKKECYQAGFDDGMKEAAQTSAAAVEMLLKEEASKKEVELNERMEQLKAQMEQEIQKKEELMKEMKENKTNEELNNNAMIENKKLQETISELQLEMKGLMEEKSNLTRQLEDLSMELEKNIQQQTKEKEKVENLFENQLKQMKDEIDREKAKNDKRAQEIEEAAQLLLKGVEEEEKKQRENENIIKDEKEKLQQEKERLGKTISEMQLSLEKTENENKYLKKLIQRLQNRKEKVRAENSIEEDENQLVAETNKEDLCSADKIFEANEITDSDASSQPFSESEQSQKQDDNWQTIQLSSSLSKLNENSLDSNKETHLSLMQTVESLQKESLLLKEQIEKLKKEKVNQQEVIEQMKATINESERKEFESIEKAAQAAAEADEIKRRFEEMQLENVAKNENKTLMEQKSIENEQFISALNFELEQKSAKIDQLTDELKSKEQQIKMLKDEVRKREKDLKEAKHDLNEAENEVVRQVQKFMEEQNESFTKLREKQEADDLKICVMEEELLKREEEWLKKVKELEIDKKKEVELLCKVAGINSEEWEKEYAKELDDSDIKDAKFEVSSESISEFGEEEISHQSTKKTNKIRSIIRNGKMEQLKQNQNSEFEQTANLLDTESSSQFLSSFSSPSALSLASTFPTPLHSTLSASLASSNSHQLTPSSYHQIEFSNSLLSTPPALIHSLSSFSSRSPSPSHLQTQLAAVSANRNQLASALSQAEERLRDTEKEKNEMKKELKQLKQKQNDDSSRDNSAKQKISDTSRMVSKLKPPTHFSKKIFGEANMKQPKKETDSYQSQKESISTKAVQNHIEAPVNIHHQETSSQIGSSYLNAEKYAKCDNASQLQPLHHSKESSRLLSATSEKSELKRLPEGVIKSAAKGTSNKSKRQQEKSSSNHPTASNESQETDTKEKRFSSIPKQKSTENNLNSSKKCSEPLVMHKKEDESAVASTSNLTNLLSSKQLSSDLHSSKPIQQKSQYSQQSLTSKIHHSSTSSVAKKPIVNEDKPIPSKNQSYSNRQQDKSSCQPHLTQPSPSTDCLVQISSAHSSNESKYSLQTAISSSSSKNTLSSTPSPQRASSLSETTSGQIESKILPTPIKRLHPAFQKQILTKQQKKTYSKISN